MASIFRQSVRLLPNFGPRWQFDVDRSTVSNWLHFYQFEMVILSKQYLIITHQFPFKKPKTIRNAMYNISLKNLLENQSNRLEWESTPAHKELCTLKGKQESDCQNYIRVFSRIDENKVMVCGTNSYKPLCRRYKNGQGNSLTSASHEDESAELDSQSTTSESVAVALSSSTETDASLSKTSSGETFDLIEEFDGQGRCPYNPTHNSSYIFTGKLFNKSRRKKSLKLCASIRFIRN